MNLVNPDLNELEKILEEIRFQFGLEYIVALQNAVENEKITWIYRGLLKKIIERYKEPNQCPRCLSQLKFYRTHWKWEHYKFYCPECGWEESVFDPRDI